MIEFELDGKKVRANPGQPIIEIALAEGRYIPHFCYHKKLSIAANCRMCLVEVEKAPKPLPACATPVTEGMKVHTCSKLAREAQQGVMEFLLINHPLDCPICDQGGECQLQDLAVGYGKGHSRFDEDKRSVSNKDLGPLVRTVMTRCIHCSRCVRFTDEIAGYQELGMAYRNNHVEVMPFIGKTVDSELSGNIIDICPVGALTSKPFRDTSRVWELSRRKTISPHDGLGSNLIVNVDKYHKVVRVLPNENDSINECWLSDKDRFAYEGLYHAERVTEPMIKQDGKWIQVEWDVAIEYAAKSINGVKIDHTAAGVGVLASAISTTEELFLLQKMMRALDVNNIDSRLSQSDFALDGKVLSAISLGSSLDELLANKSILFVGSQLRFEQPVLSARVRHAAKKDLKISLIDVIKQDLLAPVSNQILVDVRQLEYTLAQVLKSIVGSNNAKVSVDLSEIKTSEATDKIAKELLDNKGSVVLGKIVKDSPCFANCFVLANLIAEQTGGTSGVLASLGNEVGANLVGFIPHRGSFNSVAKIGLNVREMLEKKLKAYVLFNTELEKDAYDRELALNALKSAESVVVFSSYASKDMLDYADVILPIAPFTETAGSFVNTEGKWQKFNGVTKSLGNSKPAWKVIRVLANCLEVNGFEYNSIEDVRQELINLTNTKDYLNNQVANFELKFSKVDLTTVVRCGLTNIYNTDSIVRRATSLQATKLAKSEILVNMKNNGKLRLSQGESSLAVDVVSVDIVAPSMVVVPSNYHLAGLYDEIIVTEE